MDTVLIRDHLGESVTCLRSLWPRWICDRDRMKGDAGPAPVLHLSGGLSAVGFRTPPEEEKIQCETLGNHLASVNSQDHDHDIFLILERVRGSDSRHSVSTASQRSADLLHMYRARWEYEELSHALVKFVDEMLLNNEIFIHTRAPWLSLRTYVGPSSSRGARSTNSTCCSS
jgi:hypothetical protein